MGFLKSIVVSLGPRILGAAAAGVSGWIFAQSKGAITVNPDQVVELAGSMITAYAVTHRAVSALGVNKGDAASATLAKAENTAVAEGTAVVPDPPVSR